MPFPKGRIGTRDFYRRTGVSKSEFFRDFRHDPEWIQRLDICQDPNNGRLNFCEQAADRLARERRGLRAVGRSPRVNNFGAAVDNVECIWCAEQIKVKAKICKHCGRPAEKMDGGTDRYRGRNA